jgi:hypothetical protein
MAIKVIICKTGWLSKSKPLFTKNWFTEPSVVCILADVKIVRNFSVCVGSININHKTDLATMKSFENCTVLEGSFQLNSALLDYQKEKLPPAV